MARGLIGISCILGFCAVIVTGCGVGKYNERLAAVVDKGRVEGGSVAMQTTESDFPGTSYKFRLPAFVNSSAKPFSKSPELVALPAFKGGYEVTMDGEPVHCFFAAPSVSDVDRDQLLGQIQNAVSKEFQTASWEDMEVVTDEGSALSMKRMAVTGKLKIGGSEKEGMMELFFYQPPAASHFMLVGWLCTEANMDKITQASHECMRTFRSS